MCYSHKINQWLKIIRIYEDERVMMTKMKNKQQCTDTHLIFITVYHAFGGLSVSNGKQSDHTITTPWMFSQSVLEVGPDLYYITLDIGMLVISIIMYNEQYK